MSDSSRRLTDLRAEEADTLARLNATADLAWSRLMDARADATSAARLLMESMDRGGATQSRVAGLRDALAEERAAQESWRRANDEASRYYEATLDLAAP